MGEIEQRLERMGIELPNPLDPDEYGFRFVTAVRHANMLYLSGNADLSFVGKVGAELGVEEGRLAARAAALQCLAVIKDKIGSLDKVRQIFKVSGFVNSAAGFSGQAAVMDGCSDFLVEVFGERGRHARSAVGTSALPMGFAVEIEMIVIVDDDQSCNTNGF